MTAALVGAIEGLDVLLCEKTDQVGGTSATSAGTIWIPARARAEKPVSRTGSPRQRDISMR
jgi:succinate dehydrogenase/fumarate reductase flavoprotein subunit